MVPLRAYLPDDMTNFITRTGMDQLLTEKEELINEKENPGITDENERRLSLNHINAKLQLLNYRIAEDRITLKRNS
jgi:transcription elongation factor GreB